MEKKKREELEPDIKIAHSHHQAWSAEKEAILNQIRRATYMGEAVTFLKQQYVSIMEKEPLIPLLPTHFFEDTTQEAIASHIAHGWLNASIWSDEGGIFLSGYGMQTNTTKFIALLNRLWDGKDFISHRKTSKSFTIANRRLTVSLMLQPLLMQQMIRKDQGIVRQSGFMGRSLMTCPPSVMGKRFYEEPSETIAAMQNFHERIVECLDESLILDRKGCHEIPTLTFSTQAKLSWISYFNEVESSLGNTDKWPSINDFASKAAENLARIAALLHLFEGKDGQINSEDVECAGQIVNWYLTETKRILSDDQNSAGNEDTIKLLNWIKMKGIKNTTPQYLQQYSPIREKVKRDFAINILMDHNCLKKINSNGKTQLIINPKIVSAD